MKFLILTAEPENFVPVELKKEAESAGHTCDLVDPAEIMIVCAGDKVQALHDGKDLTGQYDIVIPRFSEHDIEHKLSVLEILQREGAMALNDHNAIGLASDKFESAKLFIGLKMNTPRTASVRGDANIEKIGEDFGYPLIVKTVSGTHGIGVVKVDTPDGFKSVAQLLDKEGIKYIVQEFVEHKQSARIVMLFDKILAANLRGHKDGKDFRTNSHLGADTEAYEPSEKELELAKALCANFCETAGAAAFNFAAIDYIIKDDELIVLEINGSPGLEGIQKNFPDRNLPKEVIELCAARLSDGSVEKVGAADGRETPTGGEAEQYGNISLNEPIVISRFNDEKELITKIDTGANICSLHARNIETDEDKHTVTFEYGDTKYRVPYSRTVTIIKGGEVRQSRPVVLLDVEFCGERHEQVEFTLVDRTQMKYDVLVGLNLLKQIKKNIEVKFS